MSDKKKKVYERIDGVVYEWNSPGHREACRKVMARNARNIVQSGIADQANLDANGVAFLARDLLQVVRETQDIIFDKLEMKNFLTVTSQLSPGAESWAYRQRTEVGQALIGAHLHADDIPLVSFAEQEFVFGFLNATAGYEWTVDDLEKSDFGGLSLRRELPAICGRVIARALDKIGRVGKPEMGIFGFFNNPNVPQVTLTHGEWLTATVAEIQADLFQIETAARTNSRSNFPYRKLVLPLAYESRLRQLTLAADSSVSVADWFFGDGTTRGVSRTFNELVGYIALDEATGTDIAVDDAPMGVALADAPGSIVWDIPIAYKEEPPQARNFKFVVPARARSSGVVFKQPNAALYIKNLD